MDTWVSKVILETYEERTEGEEYWVRTEVFSRLFDATCVHGDVNIGRGGKRCSRVILGGNFYIEILKNGDRNGPIWTIRPLPGAESPHPLRT